MAKRSGENPESVLFGLFMLGLLVARISFVIAYWAYFRDDPLQMLDIRDGGFLPWAGLLALLLGSALFCWRRPRCAGHWALAWAAAWHSGC